MPLWERSTGYGFPGVRVDGNDVLACLAVTRWALDECRSGNGPVMIEAFTYRMDAHTTSDDPTRYRMAAEEEHWKLLDPIQRVKAHLSRQGLADQEFFDSVGAEADELAARFRAHCIGMEKPPPERIFANVYTEPHTQLQAQQREYLAYLATFADHGERAAMTAETTTLAKALNTGLRSAMEDDPKVIVMGEDVGKLGGVFRVTDGSAEGFRRPSGAGHPTGRVRDHRHRSRSRDARVPAGDRDPVRRVRLSRGSTRSSPRSRRSPTALRAPGRCRW